VWRRPKQKSVPSPPPQQQQVQQQREGSVSPPPAPKSDEPSAEYLALKNALVRLIIKDKETGVFGGGSSVAKKPAFPDPMSFLKEGRKLVKQGDLAIETKSNSIWSRAPNKRRLTLLSDTLIISIPQSGNVAALEYVIDLQICKVKSLGHVFTLHQSGSDDTQNEDDLSFELLWPGGDIHLIADNLAMKEEWVLYIYHAICDSVAGTVQYLGWRHQYLVGTMHSAVLTRNEERVKELIALCKAEKLDFKAIESFDEDGYTPLHYACMLRLQNIVRLLHEATADVTATDNNGLTPLHWAALQLDDYSLTLLCSHVFDIDLLDRKQRSPLVIACLEGRDISGVTDIAALTRCLEVMVTHKPNLSWKDDLGRSLLHYLAASWQHEPMEILLENGCVEVNSFEDEFGMPPLHFACRASPMKNAIGEGFKIMNDGKSTDHVDNQPEPINSPCGIDTLRILLQYGAKPNMKDRMGRTALQILFLPENEILWEKEELEPAVALLLSYGCRLPNEEMINVIKAKFPELNVLALFEKWNALPPIDGTKIGLR
jgi:ankyrin repeat protein